ncbi:DUF7501 family protein [Haloparvum sedimenti]|uniref:DUF7501 family protein n=1 Tax=Haloparvum sedimenti TaxID=1678448 RepID=UPI00071E9531|nr:hypothetical protein [Haloparvum sedimenti]
MSAETPTTVEATWSDPNECPFCGAALADPGAGFVDHVAENPDCDRRFETWRDRVAGDMGGEWSG